MIIPNGTLVHLPGHAEYARVVGYGLCPDACGQPAYTVERLLGCFTSWPSPYGTWHAGQTIVAEETECDT